MPKTYRGITPAQHRVLVGVAVSGRTYSAQQRTLEALEALGLVQLTDDLRRPWEVPVPERQKLWAWLGEQERLGLNIPEPECRCGYTRRQVGEIMGDRLETFDHWMRGQTVALCEGRSYDHDTEEYSDACGGVAHGPVVYAHDLRGFLKGRPIFD